MRNRQRLMLSDEDTENFWPSFTDLISTIAMILFVLVLLAYIQNLISGKNLERVRTELNQSLSRLRGAQQELKTADQKLRLLAAEIKAGQTQLELSQSKLGEQQTVIADATRELTEVRSRVQGIAVLRLDVLKKVKQSIDAQLSAHGPNGGPLARIAENGNIVIDESLVFEFNSHTIKQDGRRFLDMLAKAFANVLADPAVRQNIDVVLVQGHTDERGSIAYNRELSAKRADAVLNYMFEANKTLEQSYGSYFASSAYSEFRPLNLASNEAAYQQNRRIEISVVLKDAGIRDLIDQYMRNINPALQGPADAAKGSATDPL
jgi:chemotaxis protein MotB